MTISKIEPRVSKLRAAESAQASELAPMLRPKGDLANRNRPGHLLFPTVTNSLTIAWLLIDVQIR